MAGRLPGKVCIITGTGGSMGRATALTFAREGAKVVGCDVAVEPAEETVALVEAAGGEMVSLQPCVLSDPVLGVSMFSPHEFESAVAAVRQPIVDQMFTQPLAPFALSGHPAPDRKNSKHGAGSGKRQKKQRLFQERRSVLLL